MESSQEKVNKRSRIRQEDESAGQCSQRQTGLRLILQDHGA